MMAAFRVIAALILFAHPLILVLGGAVAIMGAEVDPEVKAKINIREMWVPVAILVGFHAIGAWQILRGRGRGFAWVTSLMVAMVWGGRLRLVGSLPLAFLVAELAAPWLRRRLGRDSAGAEDQTAHGAAESKRNILETGTGIAVIVALSSAWHALPAWMHPAKPASGDDGGVLATMAGLWLGVLVHELGHALAGAAVGFRMSRLAVFPFEYLRSSKRSYFRLNFAVLGGFYMGIPTHVRHLRRRHMALTAAGPAFGFLFAFLSWALLWRANGAADGFAYGVLAASIWFGLVNNLLNLLPIQMSGLRLDGRVLWGGMFRHREEEAALAVLACCSSLYSPLRPRDWPEDWVEFLRETSDALTIPLLIEWAEDRLNIDPGDLRAMSDLARCSVELDRIASLIPDKSAKNSFLMHRAWVRCRYGGESRVAPELLVEAGNDPETDLYEILRLEAALCAAAGDRDGALERVTEAERSLAGQPRRCGFDDAALNGLRSYRAQLAAE
ncbi:MAG: M50 family metallopeptidase [Bryobacteraceae bacterium]